MALVEVHRTVTALLSIAMLGSVLLAQGAPMVEYHNGAAPPLGEEHQVVQGEALFSEFAYATQKAARLLGDATVKRKTVFSQGDTLLGFSGKNEDHYCQLAENWMGELFWKCLVPSGDQFVQRFVTGTGIIGRHSALRQAVDYESTEVPLQADTVPDEFFRKEIVYQGAAGGILRLMYREFGDDLARPAFSQELTYDWSGDPLSIAVKGARIEVLEAGNQGIRYRVLNGFAPP